MTIVNYKTALPPPVEKQVVDSAAKMQGGEKRGADLIQASTLRKLVKGASAQEKPNVEKRAQRNANPISLVVKDAFAQEKPSVVKRAQKNVNPRSLKVANAASSQEKLNVRKGARDQFVKDRAKGTTVQRGELDGYDCHVSEIDGEIQS